MRPPPMEAATTSSTLPFTPVRFSLTVLGCASTSSTWSNENFIPASSANSKLCGILASSTASPKSPATIARSVPWPLPVAQKEPCR